MAYNSQSEGRKATKQSKCVITKKWVEDRIG